MGDELRKTIEHIVGRRVLPAQEGTEGGSSNVRNLRQDLYKKICSGDPIARRLPRAKSSRMASLRRMMRFDLNRPLTFNNARGKQWGRIYRRSLVMKMKGEFLPPSEYASLGFDNKEEKGIFAKKAL